MNTTWTVGAITFTAWQIVLILAALAVIAAGLYLYIQQARKKRLRKKYAPEYDRLISEGNSRATAEAELLRRERRVERYRLRSLKRGERERFATAWRAAQARFVEDPRMAVAEADELVCRVMRERGYPIGDFDQRAEDISVDHPEVVINYRAAHDIALRDHAQPVETEDLRRAMVHYKALFEDLLEEHVAPREVVHR
jgi:hypothetical protein